MSFHRHVVVALAAVAIVLLSTQHSVADHPSINDIRVTAHDDSVLPGGNRIENQEISAKRSATSDTASLLRGLPGVSVYGAGAVSSLPALHGLADDRLRIKVDGMDLVSACGNHMNPPLSYIDPTAIESIEVFAGISPVSMGGDSIGGTIAVVSSRPEFSSDGSDVFTAAEVGTFYRSNGNNQGVNGSLDLANDWLSLRYQGAFARGDNYKAGGEFKAPGNSSSGTESLGSREVGSTYYETQNHNLTLAIEKNNHLVDLDIGYQHIPNQGFPNQRMDMLENTSTQIALKHQAEYRWGNVESRLYQEKTEHAMNFGEDKQFWYGDAPGMPMKTEGTNIGGMVSAKINLDSINVLKLGSKIQFYSLDDWWPPSGSGMMMSPNTFWNIKEGERDRYALFGEWQSQPTDQWLTLIGIRYESVQSNADDIQGYSMMYATDAALFNAQDHSKQDDNWDVSAQARYTLDEHQIYEIGIARKSRSPNLYERYTWSSVGMAMRMVNLAGDGNGYVGNLALEPEIAHTLSVSADWHDASKEHWQVIITPFYTQVDDFIDATPCTSMMCNMSNAFPGFRYLTFSNDDARLYGVDVSAFRHLTQSPVLGNVTGKLVLSYVDGENERTGDNLHNIMPLNATLHLQQNYGHWENSIEWQLVSAKNDISAVRNEMTTHGYGLLHLRSMLTMQKVRFDVGIENVLDKNYDLPLGGAYLGEGKTMSGGDVPWGTTAPGPGRSVYAGVTYTF